MSCAHALWAIPPPWVIPTPVAYQKVTDLFSMLGYRSVEAPRSGIDQERTMGKGLDKKKEQKKKPAKTLEEKRAAKREKKAARG